MRPPLPSPLRLTPIGRQFCGWIITDQALDEEDWTPELIEKRGAELIRRAKGAMRSPLT
jgi:hypothetical protein